MVLGAAQYDGTPSPALAGRLPGTLALLLLTGLAVALGRRLLLPAAVAGAAALALGAEWWIIAIGLAAGLGGVLVLALLVALGFSRLVDVGRWVLETALAAELTDHLGYEPGDPRPGGNARNGTTPKTMRTDIGQVRIDVPRDRAGTFEPVSLSV